MIYERATKKVQEAGHPLYVCRGEGYIYFSPMKEAPVGAYDQIDSIMSNTITGIDVLSHVEEQVENYKDIF